MNLTENMIIDFGAKNQFTHHSPLIQKLSEIITDKGEILHVLLPIYADKNVFKNTKGKKEYLLSSTVFGPSFRELPFKYLFFRFIDIYLGKYPNSKHFRSFCRVILIRRPKRFIINIIKKHNSQIRIIFPTTDPLSVDLAKKLLKKYHSNLCFLFRIVGSESRGQIANGKELEELKLMSEIFPNSIRIGFETSGYRKLLMQLGFNKELLFWSPWPQLDNSTEMAFNNKNIIKIGFLGMAKKRKGFDLIPDICREILATGINFEISVQETIYPWPEYERTLLQLKTQFQSNCKILPASLTLTDLQNEIKKLDLLILPYDPYSYSINASGLLYHACDYNIPVATFDGVGFADEITNYHIGFLFSEIHELRQICKQIFSKNNDFNFNGYNLAREKATTLFIYGKVA